MATLRRGLVDTVKKAASKVRARGVQVAAKAGTRGARVLVETTVAAVKTVDKLQEKLGRRSSRVRFTEKARASEPLFETPVSRPVAQEPKKAAKAEGATAKPRRVPSPQASEAPPVELRDAGRKTVPAAGAAPKRSKKAKAPGKQFKVKRGQKHLHSGR